MFGWLQSKLLPGAALIALGAVAWGYAQGLRADRAEAASAAASLRVAQVGAELQQCRLDAAMRTGIDRATADIDRRDDADLSDWLRARAAGERPSIP